MIQKSFPERLGNWRVSRQFRGSPTGVEPSASLRVHTPSPSHCKETPSMKTKQEFIRAAAIALLAASGTDEYGRRDYRAAWAEAERLWAAKPSKD